MENWGEVNLFCQTSLLLLAILLNALFIISTRSNKQNLLVATEILQRCKTIQIIICLVFYVPIEVYALYSKGALTTILCAVKDFIEKLLMGLIPSGYLALAILRFRVWKCTGIASAILKNKSAYMILFICSIVPITMAMTSFVLSMSLQKDEQYNNTYSHCIDHSFPALRITTFVVVDIVPAAMAVTIYWKLHHEIKVRANRDTIEGSGRTASLTRSILKDIEKSLLSFLIILVLTWIPYISLKCFIFVVDLNSVEKVIFPTLYVYNIIFVCLFHPFAEGICLKHRRIKLRLAWSRLMERNRVGFEQRRVERFRETESISTTDKMVAGFVSQRMLQTVVEEEPTKEKTDIEINFTSKTGNNNASMLNFYEMENRSTTDDSPVEDSIKGNNHKVSEVIVRVDHHFRSPSSSNNETIPSVSKDYLSPNTLPNAIESPICPIITGNLKHDDENKKNIRCSQTSEPLRLLSTSSSSVFISRNMSSLSDWDNYSAPSIASHTSTPCNCRSCTRRRKTSNRSNRSNFSETSSCRSKLSRCSNKSSCIPGSIKTVSFATSTDPDTDALSIISDYF